MRSYCSKCNADAIGSEATCRVCGAAILTDDGAPTPTPGADQKAYRVIPVSVVDIDLPFGSMVKLMVTWSIAAIPAAAILAGVGFFVFLMLSALF